MGTSVVHSFIHSIFHISIHRLNTKDVEIVIVVTLSGKVTNIRCFNTIIIQWSHSNYQIYHQNNYNKMCFVTSIVHY
jgi:hypothetical protein